VSPIVGFATVVLVCGGFALLLSVFRRVGLSRPATTVWFLTAVVGVVYLQLFVTASLFGVSSRDRPVSSAIWATALSGLAVLAVLVSTQGHGFGWAATGPGGRLIALLRWSATGSQSRLVSMDHPASGEQYGHVPRSSLPAEVPQRPGGAGAPGVVRAARVLLWVQGVVSALAVLLAVAALILVVPMWESLTGTGTGVEGVVGAFVNAGVLIMVFLVAAIGLMILVIAVGVAVPSLILAARFGSRRNGVRVGALVLEAIIGGLCLLAAASSVIEGNFANGAIWMLPAALGWTVFGLLLSPRAVDHFRA
jgi:hypothetical protein